METLLLEMRSMRSEVQQITKSLEELKAENTILRKEIFGVGKSSKSNSENCLGLMKAETLRELIEEIQFDVGKIKEAVQIERTDTNDVNVGKIGLGQTANGNTDSMEEYKPAMIRSQEEEDEKLLARWHKLKLQEQPLLEGSTLAGTTMESIRSSIKLSETVKASTILIISNHLHTPIQSYTEYYGSGRRTRGPLEIRSHTTEVFSFEGDGGAKGPSKQGFTFRGDNKGSCTFAYSFKISPTLSLAIYSSTLEDGDIKFSAGFTPPNILADFWLSWALVENSQFSAHCFSTDGYLKDASYFLISTKDYVARIEMSSGPQSIVELEILEEPYYPLPILENIQGIRNGESVGDMTVVDYLNLSSRAMENVTLLPIACVVEIINGLGVSLQNGEFFAGKLKNKISPPSEVVSFTREMFASTDESVAEGIFSYEIQETGLKILIAFKCEEGKNNSFCATIVPLEIKLSKQKLNNLMNPKDTWNTSESRRLAQAEDGEQLIVSRNIHLTARMSIGKISTLKIFVFSI